MTFPINIIFPLCDNDECSELVQIMQPRPGNSNGIG